MISSSETLERLEMSRKGLSVRGKIHWISFKSFLSSVSICLFTCIGLSGYAVISSYPLNTYPHFLLYFHAHCFDHDVIESVRIYNVCNKLTPQFYCIHNIYTKFLLLNENENR